LLGGCKKIINLKIKSQQIYMIFNAQSFLLKKSNMNRILNISLKSFTRKFLAGRVVSSLVEKRVGMMLVFLFAFSKIICGQTTYTSNGTFTVPAGITSIKVECWGAGGSGGGSTANTVYGGGGGAGGSYANKVVTVIPGNTYTVTVGGVTTGSTSAGVKGNPSWFGTAGTVYAEGGAGGAAPNGGNVAGGTGTTSTSIGTIIYAGGNGAGGTAALGGAGGGGAGSTGAGGNAAGTTSGGGTSVSGGNGGSGRTSSGDGSNGASVGGGGAGAFVGGGTDRAGGDGAAGYVVITLPANVVLSSPTQVTAANVYQGSTLHPIFSFSTTISTLNATLNTVSFTTAGTYSAPDILNFQLYYSTTNDITTAIHIGSNITTSLGIGSHSFTGLTQVTNSGTTGYFWITADITNGATSGHTISVNPFATTNLAYEIASITGSTSVGGTQTILPVPAIVLSSSNPAVAAANLNQGTVEQPIYSFSTAITNANAALNSFTFTTSGTYAAADITKFKLWYNTTNNLSTATQIGSPIISTLGTGSHTFSGITLTTNAGSTGYFWITVDVASIPTNANTISVNAITTANLTYLMGFKSGTAYAGGIQTIQVLSGILISSNHPAVSAASLLQGTVKQPFYKFTTIIAGGNVTLNSVSFTTTGSYAASDVSNFKLWYNTVNSLVTATQLGTTITTTLGSGTHTFSGLSQSTNAGNTGYFWITVDMATAAIPGNTLYVNAITASNLTYASGTKYGSTYAGGIQTILLNIDSDGDGVPDIYDLDDDNDGIPDIVENAPCNASAIELFPNSDFSAGNTGFTSAYTYVTGTNSLYPEGDYTVTNNPNSVHDMFGSCGDHTTGTGNMMVVNGDPTPNKIVWSSGLISVTPNTDYTLSLYLSSVTTGNPAQLIFNVNGENIGTQFNATATNCQWVNAVAVWNSGSNTSATFDIVNLNLIAAGNDFALDDISCKYRINCDSDGDGIPDKLDLDSDNDGIYDVVEAGGTDANNDGIIDGFVDNDHDGLADIVDNQDSGSGTGEVISGTALANPDTDGDGLVNRIDTDSDGDGCTDAKEAGFTDADNDGKLGSSPVTVNTKGKVTSATGYTTPANLDGPGNTVKDYVQQVPYITAQPSNKDLCVSSPTNTSFTVSANNTGGTYQWQVSTDNGATWSNLSNGGIYSTVTTATLNLTTVTAAYDGYMYRLLLSHPAYICSPLISTAVTLRAFGAKPAQPGIINGDVTVCPSVSGLGYSITVVPQTVSYAWTLPSGWSLTAGTGTNAITATSGTTGGNIQVSGINTCGTGTARLLAVTVAAPAPTFTAPTATTACQSVDVTYTTQSGKSNYVWNITTGSLGADYTITSGGTSLDNSMTLKWLTVGSKSVTVSYTSGGCSGTDATKTITVNSNAIITVQPVSPAAMCAGSGSSSISVTATGSVTSYQWQVSTDGGSTWNNISNVAPYSNVTTASMSISSPPIGLNNAQYHCLVIGSCGTVTSNAATLTVNVTAISSQSTAAQTKCVGSAFTAITVTATGVGLSYQWYSNTTATTTGGTSLGAGNGGQTNSYTPQSGTAGTLYYYCIVTGTCSSATSSASGAFIVNPLPLTGPVYRKPNK
jgi:hypothetical protein